MGPEKRLPPGKVFVGKYELTAIHLPADGAGPTELHLTPVSEETHSSSEFPRRYLFVEKEEGKPLIMHIEDVRLLKLLEISKIYHVTFQKAE